MKWRPLEALAMILLNLLDDGERYRLETTFDENWRWSRRFVDDPDFDNFLRLSMSFDDFWRTIFCKVWMTASGTVWSFLGTKNEFLWPDGFWQVLTEVFEKFLTSSDGFRWVPTAFVEFWRVLKRRKTGLWSENRTFDVFFGEILLTAANGDRYCCFEKFTFDGRLLVGAVNEVLRTKNWILTCFDEILMQKLDFWGDGEQRAERFLWRPFVDAFRLVLTTLKHVKPDFWWRSTWSVERRSSMAFDEFWKTFFQQVLLTNDVL